MLTLVVVVLVLLPLLYGLVATLFGDRRSRRGRRWKRRPVKTDGALYVTAG